MLSKHAEIDFVLEGLDRINVSSHAHPAQMGFAHCALAAEGQTRIL